MSEDPRDPEDLLATRLGRKLGNWIGQADFFIDTFINAMRDEYDRHLAGLSTKFKWQSPIVVKEDPPKPWRPPDQPWIPPDARWWENR